MKSRSKRPRHNCKEVEEVLVRLEHAHWIILYPSGHWGRAECGAGCRVMIPGTPSNCGNAANRVLRTARKCHHGHRPD